MSFTCQTKLAFLSPRGTWRSRDGSGGHSHSSLNCQRRRRRLGVTRIANSPPQFLSRSLTPRVAPLSQPERPFAVARVRARPPAKVLSLSRGKYSIDLWVGCAPTRLKLFACASNLYAQLQWASQHERCPGPAARALWTPARPPEGRRRRQCTAFRPLFARRVAPPGRDKKRGASRLYTQAD